jgi:hypothetical protein
MADSEARAKADMEARHKEKVDELEGELAKQRDAQKELFEAGQRRIKVNLGFARKFSSYLFLFLLLITHCLGPHRS